MDSIVILIGFSVGIIYAIYGIYYISKNLFPYVWRNDLDKGIRMLIKDLNKAKKKVYIVSRSCTPACYNNKEVVEAFEKAAERGAKITIITGVPLDEKCELVKLERENKIEIYSHPSIKYHLRFVDGKWIFTQTDNQASKRSFLRAKNPPIGIISTVRKQLKTYLKESEPVKIK